MRSVRVCVPCAHLSPYFDTVYVLKWILQA